MAENLTVNNHFHTVVVTQAITLSEIQHKRLWRNCCLNCLMPEEVVESDSMTTFKKHIDMDGSRGKKK